MPIPPFTPEGWLPPGEHPCTIDEVKASFVEPFATSTTRGQIFAALAGHLANSDVRSVAHHALLDGSFVSTKENPDDADVVLGLKPGSLKRVLSHPLGAGHVKTISGHFAGTNHAGRVLHIFPWDIGSKPYEHYAAYFQASTRANEPARKGILRIEVTR